MRHFSHVVNLPTRLSRAESKGHNDRFEVSVIAAVLLFNTSLILIRFFIPVTFWGLFIYGTSIPPQFEAYPNDLAFPSGQVVAKDCHCNR
jgi:hypothetical protein